MRIDAFSAALSGVSMAVTAFLYSRLPASIPIHWGFTGKPDRWGPAYWIFALPVVAVVLNVIESSGAGKSKSDAKAARYKVRLLAGLFAVGQGVLLWWILTKLA